MRRYILILCLLTGAFSAMAQSMDSFLLMAAENNPGLRARYSEFEASLQRITQVNALPDPSLSFGYFISPVETRVGPQRARVSLVQTFPWFGTLAAQRDAASLAAEAQYQGFLDAKNELDRQVKTAYYPLYELERKIHYQQENLEILGAMKEVALSRFENGQGAMADVLRADLMVNELRTELAVLRMRRRPLLAAFNQKLDRDAGEEMKVMDSLAIPTLEEGYRKDSILTSNPLMKQIELQAQMAETQQEVAKKLGMPRLGVGLDYVNVAPREDMAVPGNGKDALMPMLSVSLPIYRKKYDAAIEEAGLMRSAYDDRRENLENRLIADYEQVWFSYASSRELALLYLAQVKETDQVIRLLLSALSNADTDFEELLNMQRARLRYQLEYVAAVTTMHIAWAELDYLTAKRP